MFTSMRYNVAFGDVVSVKGSRCPFRRNKLIRETFCSSEQTDGQVLERTGEKALREGCGITNVHTYIYGTAVGIPVGSLWSDSHRGISCDLCEGLLDGTRPDYISMDCA